jgi:hypothetical protein
MEQIDPLVEEASNILQVTSTCHRLQVLFATSLVFTEDLLQEFVRATSNDSQPELELASASSVLVVQQQSHEQAGNHEEAEPPNSRSGQGRELPKLSPPEPRDSAVETSRATPTVDQPAQPGAASRVALQLRCQSLEVALEQQQQRTEALQAVLAAAHAAHCDEEASIRQYYEVHAAHIRKPSW